MRYSSMTEIHSTLSDRHSAMTGFHSPETEFHPSMTDPHSATTEIHSTMRDRHSRETEIQSPMDDLHSSTAETRSSLTHRWLGAAMGKPLDGGRDAPVGPPCRTDSAHQACSGTATEPSLDGRATDPARRSRRPTAWAEARGTPRCRSFAESTKASPAFTAFSPTSSSSETQNNHARM